MLLNKDLKTFLDKKVLEYNRPFFIEADPISIPHGYTKKQDIEISAFFAAIFAWGNRTTIINKTKELMRFMDNAPYEFCLDPDERKLKRLVGFRHRTFNDTDLLYFINFLSLHYSKNPSLETAFTKWMDKNDATIEKGLTGFHEYFFSLEDFPARTKKHIASPGKKSTCKRLNMFLRWMVRNDKAGVDFGLWKKISPAQLICPIDIHVTKVARKLNLIRRKQIDWQAAIELTQHLRNFDKNDPVKYDFALFGMGVSATGKKIKKNLIHEQ